MSKTIGIVSDTHGHFDPKLKTLFAKASLILHAGDICGNEVIRELEAIAPVAAIRGNCDDAYPTRKFPGHRVQALEDLRALLVHDLGKPEKPRPEARALIAKVKPTLVISGHSHQGILESRNGILFINPGSAGKKRFQLERSAALLVLKSKTIEAKLYSLETPRLKLSKKISFPRKSLLNQKTKLLSAGIIPVHLGSRGPRYLLLRVYNDWDFPKGVVGRNEDPLKAALRELKEETTLDEVDFRWGQSFTETPAYAGGKVARYYLARVFNTDVRLLPNPLLGFAEHHEFRWVDEAQVQGLLSPRVRAVFEWAQAQIRRGTRQH